MRAIFFVVLQLRLVEAMTQCSSRVMSSQMGGGMHSTAKASEKVTRREGDDEC